jgi:hypothetical protein
MEFEEMKRIWDEQGEGTVPEVDVDAVKERVWRGARDAERGAIVFEVFMIALMGLVGLITGIDAIVDREPLYSYVNSGIMFGIAGYVWLGRRRRLAQNTGFDQSLLGYLEKGISEVAYQVSRSRTFAWWFILPSAVAAALNMVHTFHGRPQWVWFAQPLAFLLAWAVVQHGLRKYQIPQRRALESLRDRLLNGTSG